MEATNERKGVLHRVLSARILPGFFSGEQNIGQDDSSATGIGVPATSEDHTAWRGNRKGTRQRIITPEERILELVSEHGGGMRQGEIVSTVEWSESTVSRKLQRLESTGDVTRYQIGREKLVYLPGHEPAALDSPFAAADGDAPLAH